MLLKKCFSRLAISMTLMVPFYPGAQFAMSQDAAGTWKDSATGLLWSIRDNGSASSWIQANDYCRKLDLGGHTDWRLPTRKELESIFDKRSTKEFKSKNPIELKGENIWAESTDSENAWMFNFFNGGTSMLPAAGGCGGSGRALCVRDAGK